ncbi:glutathione S-transferase family protein [Pseudomonas sp. Pse1]|uniref:glutathione S-transferase family protein n=1 Tax=Pseudomonas sp. Pse1 TaxID=2926020 RepID=UPI002117A300|nr:glutathione S-transferase family protein [Pseudomonas sp. Pse1]
MSLTLYFHPLSSYCHKVLIALNECGVEFERRIINLGNDADRLELQLLWPMGKFPVLHDQLRKRDVAESSVIIEYLDHYYGGLHPLLPSDWGRALDVRFWDRFFDNYVHSPMQEIVADRLRGTHADLSAARTTLATAYGMIERQLAGNAWIVGDDFSLADCAAAPALFYASTLVPFSAECPGLSAYFERLASRPSFARVIEEAKPYFGFYPFAEQLPARFK